MLELILKLLRPQISRVRWWIWFVATIVLILWIIERLLWPSSLVVSQWLVPTAFVLLVLSYYLQRSFWPPPLPPRDIKTRIVVVGAGPAGLSAAYFLRQQGYREVLVLEKLGHPGGLCRTITEDYHCFDLGANYVTPAYRETMNLADTVGAEMYVERPLTTIDLRESNASPKFVEPWSTVRNGMPALPYIGLCLKYMWLRFRLGAIVNPPGHAAIHEHPELCVPFSEWLERNHLQALTLLFQAPITVMGYGYLHEIATPYALKYMSVPTFAALALKAFPLTKYWTRWPKRFVLGFQRLWDAVAWNLNVRYNVNIKSIDRTDQGVRVRFSHVEQVLQKTERHEDELEFDYLIVACPLSPKVIKRFGFTGDEKELFGKVKSHSYCLTSFTTKNIEMAEPIAATLPLPDIGMPWAITKQFPDSNLFQFYSRVPDDLKELESIHEDDLDHKTPEEIRLADPASTLAEMTAKRKESRDPVRGPIVAKVREVVDRLHGSIEEDQWHTYDRWNYFQHVTAESMRAGFYRDLESLQGKNRTYFTGALLNFELVEMSIAYSKHLVETHFKELPKAARESRQ